MKILLCVAVTFFGSMIVAYNQEWEVARGGGVNSVEGALEVESARIDIRLTPDVAEKAHLDESLVLGRDLELWFGDSEFVLDSELRGLLLAAWTMINPLEAIKWASSKSSEDRRAVIEAWGKKDFRAAWRWVYDGNAADYGEVKAILLATLDKESYLETVERLLLIPSIKGNKAEYLEMFEMVGQRQMLNVDIGETIEFVLSLDGQEAGRMRLLRGVSAGLANENKIDEVFELASSSSLTKAEKDFVAIGAVSEILNNGGDINGLLNTLLVQTKTQNFDLTTGAVVNKLQAAASFMESPLILSEADYKSIATLVGRMDDRNPYYGVTVAKVVTSLSASNEVEALKILGGSGLRSELLIKYRNDVLKKWERRSGSAAIDELRLETDPGVITLLNL